MGQPADPDKSTGYDHRLVEALENPVRADFIRLLARRTALSAAEALPLLELDDLSLDKLAYQARLLVGFGLIETTGESQPGQAPLFRLTENGKHAMIALGGP